MVTTVAHYTTGSNLPPVRIVVHATNPGLGYPAASAAGTAQATSDYFRSPSSGGSAHVVCDVSTIVRCADDDVICWGAPPNEHSLHVEICADGGDPAVAPKNYSRDQWLSPQVWPAVQRAAGVVRQWADTYGIDVSRRVLAAGLLANGGHGLCGHIDVSDAWHQTDHTDPGPDFPWDRFLQLLNPPKPAPTEKDTDMRVIFHKPGKTAAFDRQGPGRAWFTKAEYTARVDAGEQIKNVELDGRDAFWSLPVVGIDPGDV